MFADREGFNKDLICPLCGKNKVEHNGKRYIGREHVPPRLLFTEGTTDLITVPSCKECNNLTSSHDLNFKISMGLYLGDDAPAFWRSTLTSLNKNEKRRQIKSRILEKISPLLTRSPFGVYGHKISIDKKPIRIVATKIARGLHWHLTGTVLPSKLDLKIIFLSQGQPINPESQSILNKHGHLLVTGKGSFQAHYAFVPNNSASLWKLSFYGVDCLIIGIKPIIS